MIIVSVLDVKAESFSQPSCSANKATALRDFATAVNQPGSLLNSHPDDFVLYQLGDFDPQMGVISSSARVSLACGRDVFAEVKS